MLALETDLIQYLSAVAGDRPWLEPAAEVTTRLPLFLRSKYRTLRADLFGRKAFFAIENRPTTEPSPTEYARHAETLKKLLAGDVVLVIADIPSYVRNRMVRQHVPFIVPGTQMFLPMLMIDLREQYPRRRGRSEHLLSAVAQVVVIYHLVREPLNGIPSGKIALRLGYSAMSLSKAHDELQNANVCQVVRSGRASVLQFKGTKRDIWRTAEQLLTTPVKRTHWIRWGHPRPTTVAAGLTALSRYTFLADDSIPTFAMRDRQVVAALERGDVVGCAGREDAQARLEAWRYDPGLLTNDGNADACSLYLSLRRSADERVQKELSSLLDASLR